MPGRLLDTNIVSYQLKNHRLAKVYQRHVTGYALAVSFQTVAEMLEGAALAGWSYSRRAALETLLGTMTVHPGDRLTCDHWAIVRAARRNQPMPVADAWIAATALAYGLELVTHNPADFAGVPGLIIITEAT